MSVSSDNTATKTKLSLVGGKPRQVLFWLTQLTGAFACVCSCLPNVVSQLIAFIAFLLLFYRQLSLYVFFNHPRASKTLQKTSNGWLLIRHDGQVSHADICVTYASARFLLIGFQKPPQKRTHWLVIDRKSCLKQGGFSLYRELCLLKTITPIETNDYKINCYT